MVPSRRRDAIFTTGYVHTAPLMKVIVLGWQSSPEVDRHADVLHRVYCRTSSAVNNPEGGAHRFDQYCCPMLSPEVS
jgi:hypothetical protein